MRNEIEIDLEEALDLLFADTIVNREIIDESRWSFYKRHIVKYDDKLFEMYLSFPKGESESLSDYNGQNVKLTEVRPVEKTIIVYEPVDED